MSGFTCGDFRHNCDTHGCYMKVHAPNWEWMRGSFPRRIMPTDIDGMVEINGHVLFLEHKARGGAATGGQKYALQTLARLRLVTVLEMRDHPDGIECRRYDDETGHGGGWHLSTQDQVRKWLRWWSAQADTRAS